MNQKKIFEKKLIYIFILLTIYDGILRKWILPSASNAIMVLKVLVGILIIFKGSKYFSHLTIWDRGLVVCGIIGFITALAFGHGNPVVAIWGCLPLWMIPMCVIFAREINYEEIIKIGKIFLYTAILNFLITAFEFTQPVNSFINKGNDIDLPAGMSIADLAGAFRPSGIFMSNASSSSFVLLAFSFCLFFLYEKTATVNKRLLYIAIISCILTPIFTISRTMVFYIVGMGVVYLIFAAKRGLIKRLVFPSILIVILGSAIVTTSLGQTALNSMSNRFEAASAATVGGNKSTSYGTAYDIVNRTIIYNIKALVDPHTIDGQEPPFFGYGQGMSTQVGGRLLGINANAGFALAEWDGLRIVCESGLLLGWIIIFFRLGYFLRFLGRFRKTNPNKLSIFLYPTFAISFYLQNTWGNAFYFCFAFISGGLYLASINKKNIKINKSNQ